MTNTMATSTFRPLALEGGQPDVVRIFMITATMGRRKPPSASSEERKRLRRLAVKESRAHRVPSESESEDVDGEASPLLFGPPTSTEARPHRRPLLIMDQATCGVESSDRENDEMARDSTPTKYEECTEEDDWTTTPTQPYHHHHQPWPTHTPPQAQPQET